MTGAFLMTASSESFGFVVEVVLPFDVMIAALLKLDRAGQTLKTPG
jgi:hypothetical protein